VTGTLGLFSLVDLFQLLSSSQRSGRLGVEHPAGLARVYFDKGQVVHAEFGDLQGEDAVFALFADERGSFEFRLGIPAPQSTITGGTENLVLEAIRRLDEARRDTGPTVARDAVPVLDTAFERAEELTLNEDERRVLAHVNAQRNVTRIALDAGLDPDETLAIVDRLSNLGVLKMRGRRARTARLVARLSDAELAAGMAGLDPGILNTWERATGSRPERVACRRQDGKVLVFHATAADGAGPYILFSRDTLFRSDLAVNEALLVRPVAKRD
jgi:hypothetical protein